MYDGVAVLTDRHVGEANVANGMNQSEIYKISVLSSGARGLLVAMVCYGITDISNKPGGFYSSSIGSNSMNTSQIRSTFATMIDVKRHTGGIQIGHECTEMNVRRWISELHDCGLIKGGGLRSLLGMRSFSGQRSEKVKK